MAETIEYSLNEETMIRRIIYSKRITDLSSIKLFRHVKVLFNGSASEILNQRHVISQHRNDPFVNTLRDHRCGGT